MEWKTGNPPKSGRYLFTITVDDVKYVDLMYYNKKQKAFFHQDQDEDGNPRECDQKYITAWMELPEPYEG